MRILQINAVYDRGSTGDICRDLEKGIISHGYEVYTAFSVGSLANEKSFLIGNKLDRKLHAFLSRITGMQGYFSVGATKRLLSYISEIRPDIVHLSNLHGNYINLKLLLRYLAKHDIATVLTLHDCWFFTGKCTHYSVEKCYKWQTGCDKCPRIKKDNKSWIFDRTKIMWNDKKELFQAIPRLGVIGVSKWVTNAAKKSYLSDARIIKHIYNWIDTEVFYPKEDNVKQLYGIPENKFIILTVGAGWTKKSPKWQDVLKLSELIDNDSHIVVVGKGLNDAKLPSNVTKINYINGAEELAKVYSCADVYAHVSREDTFGKVVAEALACGTPAVVYNSTGLPELIGDNCGYIVDCEDIKAIAEKVEEVKRKGKLYYSESCVEFVKNNFDKDKLIGNTIDLYKELLE